MTGVPQAARQRLFTAVDPPLAVREDLAAWAKAQRGGVRGVRLIAPANIHLTMAFLGERSAGEMPAILEAMARAAQFCGGEPALQVAAPILLPPRSPRVLAAGVADRNGALTRLHKELTSALGEQIDYSERRAFRPHLTLARLARDAKLPAELSPLRADEFICDELVLYRSYLEPSGARYEALERVALN